MSLHVCPKTNIERPDGLQHSLAVLLDNRHVEHDGRLRYISDIFSDIKLLQFLFGGNRLIGESH